MLTPKQQAAGRAVMETAHSDFQKALNIHAYFKMQDSEKGQDLVQDTFLKTWNYLKKGGKIVVMKAFLYHVLNNLIIDEYRKNKATSLDVLMEAGYDPGTDDHTRLIEVLDGKTTLILIGRLGLKYQKVLRMRFIEELSIAEMSARTGETKNAISVQLFRGLKQLKALYDNKYATV